MKLLFPSLSVLLQEVWTFKPGCFPVSIKGENNRLKSKRRQANTWIAHNYQAGIYIYTLFPEH